MKPALFIRKVKLNILTNLLVFCCVASLVSAQQTYQESGDEPFNYYTH